jgi:hypothetical protein
MVSVTILSAFLGDPEDDTATYSPPKESELARPACQFPKHERVCLPNATDTTELGIQFDGIENAVIPGDCATLDPYCRFSFAHDEVVLLYWPANVSTVEYPPDQTRFPLSGQESHSSRRTAVIPAVAFRGRDLYRAGVSTLGGPVWCFDHSYIIPSTMKGPFTFTSPTIYLAHHPITVDYIDETDYMSFTSRQSVRPPGIVGLKPADVSSFVPLHPTYNDTQYANPVANGKFQEPRSLEWTTAPFNFADLRDPVPARQYFDARWEDCWGGADSLRNNHR